MHTNVFWSYIGGFMGYDIALNSLCGAVDLSARVTEDGT